MIAVLDYGPTWLAAAFIAAAILIARHERQVNRDRRMASVRLDLSNVRPIFPEPPARCGEAGRVRPSLTVLAGGSGEDPPRDLGGAA